MSENNQTVDNQELDDEIAEDEPKQEKPVKNVLLDLNDGKVYRSDKTVKEKFKDSKLRAIEAFKQGQIDPEFRVVRMANGKFRCYKRKVPLVQDPINVNQIQPNVRNVQVIDETASEPVVKSKASKAHDPFSDIVYYNMSNPITKNKSSNKAHNPFNDIVYYNLSGQISEQLNKRLDAVNAEIERLRHKNSKLKNKYKSLKQAIYITEEEEHDEQPQETQHEEQEQIQPQQIPVQQIQPQPMPQPQQLRRVPAMNFNRFFN